MRSLTKAKHNLSIIEKTNEKGTQPPRLIINEAAEKKNILKGTTYMKPQLICIIYVK